MLGYNHATVLKIHHLSEQSTNECTHERMVAMAATEGRIPVERGTRVREGSVYEFTHSSTLCLCIHVLDH